jgi:hypothetical protein
MRGTLSDTGDYTAHAWFAQQLVAKRILIPPACLPTYSNNRAGEPRTVRRRVGDEFPRRKPKPRQIAATAPPPQRERPIAA